ncbi:TlyA family RNA methyltransferase [Olsenella sp. KGMB02461]|nr:TlyA family RNA methyltransferase [Olsenella sp. KGMB02461]
MASPRRRLDQELVSQGFFATPQEAMRAVMAGDVSGPGFCYHSAGTQVKAGCELHVRAQKAHVGRGALKLEGALDSFSVDPSGLACMDVGCSTGGFTEVLLDRGAASVLAVDVGYAQFDWRLRNDPRVCLLERTNILQVPTLKPKGSIDLAVCDVSFTSVTSVLGAIDEMLRDRSALVVLVKPQFEVAKELVDEGGVVTDEAARAQAVEKVSQALVGRGFRICGVKESPITGAKGNHEYLLWAQKRLDPCR